MGEREDNHIVLCALFKAKYSFPLTSSTPSANLRSFLISVICGVGVDVYMHGYQAGLYIL